MEGKTSDREGSKCITCCLREKGINLHLQEIKMDLSRGNEKAIGIFISGNKTKQLGWIPMDIISEVERMGQVQDLSPGQTIATCQRNITQHCWAQHVVCVWPPCCDVLRHVGCCWLKFENGQI